ncbi:MAG: methyltransferase domain-containing protein [Leptolyngbyaceae cyanobacterium bins.349]|nr:methyltransferase domain-containing protein [Leptolyngbyaceae cyanobacterium bins.349]
MASTSDADLSADHWEQRYQEGRTGWDLGAPAPPLVTLLHSQQAPKPGRIAVLGTGRGYDALLFAEQGFEVVGFDFAPTAIAAATQLAQERHLSAQFLQRDIFELGTEFAGQFDYVLEHTCFCAIAPDLRDAYVQLVYTLLRSGGELIALFWAHTMPGGPPFGSTVTELQQRFAPYFAIGHLERVINSVPSRQGAEYLARWQRRASGSGRQGG